MPPFLYAYQGERVVLAVNNLGGTTPLEMSVVTRAAIRQLKEAHGVRGVGCGWSEERTLAVRVPSTGRHLAGEGGAWGEQGRVWLARRRDLLKTFSSSISAKQGPSSGG